MKEFAKSTRNRYYKLALKNYLSLENKLGLCFSISKVVVNKDGEKMDYEDIPKRFPEFRKHERKIKGDWPLYENTKYRINLLEKWIKSTKK